MTELIITTPSVKTYAFQYVNKTIKKTIFFFSDFNLIILIIGIYVVSYQLIMIIAALNMNHINYSD